MVCSSGKEGADWKAITGSRRPEEKDLRVRNRNLFHHLQNVSVSKESPLPAIGIDCYDIASPLLVLKITKRKESGQAVEGQHPSSVEH